MEIQDRYKQSKGQWHQENQGLVCHSETWISSIPGSVSGWLYTSNKLKLIRLWDILGMYRWAVNLYFWSVNFRDSVRWMSTVVHWRNLPKLRNTQKNIRKSDGKSNVIKSWGCMQRTYLYLLGVKAFLELVFHEKSRPLKGSTYYPRRESECGHLML